MALPEKLSEVYIRNYDYATVPDWKYTFRVTNAEANLGQINWESPTSEAIDGTLRPNIRGLRATVRLNWNKLFSATVSGSGTTMRSFLNDMINSIVTDGDRSIEISFDDVNYFEIVPEQSTITNVYRNQIGRSSADLTFKGRSILTTIPEYLEAPSV